MTVVTRGKAFGKLLEGIIFDWSGTISDDLIAVHRAATIVGKTFGLVVDPDPFAWASRGPHTPVTDIEKRAAQAARDGDTELAQRLQAVGVTAYIEAYTNALRVVVHPATDRAVGHCAPVAINGVPAAIRALGTTGKYKLGVVSAAPKDLLDEEILAYGLGETFDDVIGECYEKHVGLAWMCEHWGISPSRVAYVGDTRGDMKAAKMAGAMYAVGVKCGYDGKLVAQADPDRLYENVCDFLLDIASGR